MLTVEIIKFSVLFLFGDCERKRLNIDYSLTTGIKKAKPEKSGEIEIKSSLTAALKGGISERILKFV